MAPSICDVCQKVVLAGKSKTEGKYLYHKDCYEYGALPTRFSASRMAHANEEMPLLETLCGWREQQAPAGSEALERHERRRQSGQVRAAACISG